MPQQVDLDLALNGRDGQERVVAVHPVRGRRGEPARVCVYRRAEAGHVEAEVEPYFPFFFISDIHLLQGFERSRFKFQRLNGEAFFQYLVTFGDQNAYWDALRTVQANTGSDRTRPKEVYTLNSPATQYLTQTGRTLFKGMAFEDLHRLQLDIETFTRAGFPDAKRPEDEIIIIALSDNRGWSHLIEGRTVSERDMLAELVRVINERDPDVIEGHNIYAFDFPYIIERCSRHNVPFAIGRDGSTPRTFPSSIRFAERVLDFPAIDIAGRHVVDTLFQVMSFDVFKRDLPSYGLKAAARYFGFADETRTYVEGADISRVWLEEPDRLLRYALDDVIETERLARHLSGSTFYLTQMVPMSYEQVARGGPAAKIEALFVREYLRCRQALPKSEWGSQTVGGYTDVFVTGVVGPVVYADVESLYPSIMLNYDVKPGDDGLELFPGLLRRLTDLRFDAKRQMKETDDPEARSELDARQTSYKNLINSFYGMLGFGMALFNDFGEADRVASTGQDLLRHMMRAIQDRGGLVIEVDTDGVLFVPPDGIRGEAEEIQFVRDLTHAMPAGIRVGFDGRFQTMLSYKKKNYALQAYDGSLKFKGSSLVSRSIERFGRRFVREAIECLMAEDVPGLHELYKDTAKRIQAHDWSVDDFARTETLKDTVERYLADVESGKRTRAATYELAIERRRKTGQSITKGDRITYYVAGAGLNIVAFESSRLASEWDATNPDENTAYYLKRLSEFARKFEPFFEPADYAAVFPSDFSGQTSLFGTDLTAIRLIQTVRRPEEVAGDVPF